MRLIARFAKENKDNFELIDVYENEIKRVFLDKQKPKAKTLAKKHP